jgi:hypothetical protein
MAQQVNPGAHLATAQELLENVGLGPGGSLGGAVQVRVIAAVAHSVLALAEQVEMLRQELAKGQQQP